MVQELRCLSGSQLKYKLKPSIPEGINGTSESVSPMAHTRGYWWEASYFFTGLLKYPCGLVVVFPKKSDERERSKEVRCHSVSFTK